MRGVAFLVLCLQALAQDLSGREVKVKETLFDSPVQDVVYAHGDNSRVFLITKNERLYWSSNKGESWRDYSQVIEGANGGGDEVRINTVKVSPADPTLAIAIPSKQKKIYIFSQSGAKWKTLHLPAPVHSVLMHPVRPTWALLSWWTGNCGGAKGNHGDGPCAHVLGVTTDAGKTVQQIASHVVLFSWGNHKHHQGNRVYFTHHRGKNVDQARLESWQHEVDFAYLDVPPSGSVRMAMIHTAVEGGNKFLVGDQFILVAQTKDATKQTVRLMSSVDGAKTFHPATLSGVAELEERWYTVLDTSEGGVILHVDSGVPGVGNVYVSDGGGARYSLSLVANVRSTQGDVEFDKILSLEGVYMANVNADVLDGTAGADSVDQAQEDRPQLGSKGRSLANTRTVISFDKGGAWQYLKPPKVDSRSNPIPCARDLLEGKPTDKCALHLHGASNWMTYAPFYSAATAAGLILGTGNVGSSLKYDLDETNTYLSRDGGVTWSEIHKGGFIYEFGDHGGLIVMLDDQKKTKQVVFSWNEGDSWFDFEVTQTPFEVDNIVTEPNSTTTSFLVLGTRDDAGVVYHLEFMPLGFPQCKGHYAPDSVQSDYETWSPSDGVARSDGSRCMLGQVVDYVRRKRTSECFNGELFERPVMKKKCTCTQEDYACEIGFVRDISSLECRFEEALAPPSPPLCSGTYQTHAYRKVPGDRCEGGWQPELVTVPCKSEFPMRASTMLLLAMFVLAGGLWYAGIRPQAAMAACGGGKDEESAFSFHAEKHGYVAGVLYAMKDGVASLFSSMRSGTAKFNDTHSSVNYGRLVEDEAGTEMGGSCVADSRLEPSLEEYEAAAKTAHESMDLDSAPQLATAAAVPKLSGPSVVGAPAGGPGDMDLL